MTDLPVLALIENATGWFYVTMCCLIFFAVVLVSMVIWNVAREVYIRRLFETIENHQSQSNSDIIILTREVTTTLADVTHTMSKTVGAIELSSSITKEIKTELLANFNATELRIVNTLARIDLTLQSMERMQVNISGERLATQVGSQNDQSNRG